MIKEANPLTQNVFRKLAEVCIGTGYIPKKWKIAQLYLIPKNDDWGFDLHKVRPIALIESFRKVVTRVVAKRLSKVCREKEILEGRNFAGLKGDATEGPIHVMNALL